MLIDYNYNRNFRSCILGAFSDQVVRNVEESKALIRGYLSTKEKTAWFKDEFIKMLNDSNLTYNQKIKLYLSESRMSEEAAKQRLDEIWDICFGANGVLN